MKMRVKTNIKNFDSELNLKLLPNNENKNKVSNYEKSPKFFSLRFYISFMSLLGCAVMYMTRINLNMAIVDMVTTIKGEGIATNFTELGFDDKCPVSTINKSENWKQGEFNWSPSTQGVVLGSFYYGYVWPQIFGGRLSEIYGPKYLIGGSIFISGLINLWTPTILRIDYNMFIASRVVLGLVQGILFPSFMVLLAKWIPRSEHSTFIPWLDVGCIVGTLIVSTGAGQLIENNIMGGWPSVFYISGMTSILWCIIWLTTISSSPSTHTWITIKELKFILNDSESNKYKNMRKSFPWRKVMTSKAFMALLITRIMLGTTLDLIISKIPAYLKDVIHFPISENGIICGILLSTLAVTTLVTGYIADKIIDCNIISKTNVRKVFEAISGVGTALTLVFIPYVGCDKQLNAILLTLCLLFVGFPAGGDVPIVADMTEGYAGTVFAIMNCITSVNGFIIPYFVGVVIDKNPDSLHLWSYLFYFTAILNILGVIVFTLFATAEPQQWESDNYHIDYKILFDRSKVKKKKKKLKLSDKYSL